MPIKNSFSEMLPEITKWRRHLHETPELLYDTVETAAFVAARLKDFGSDEVATGIGRTGVVGVIKGRETGSGRVVALRADMDALPILEDTGLEYASQNPGKMHACGHDGHTAMLLGAGQYLAQTRNFDGTVVLVFQPAEEGGAGAKAMMDDGLLDQFGIQEIYGLHNWPGMPVGTFGIRPGPFFASADQVDITIRGKGGHAAKPQETIDSALVASHVVVALQSIVSRNVDPNDKVVISITSMETASTAYNVIAPTVAIKGTLRALNEEARVAAKARFIQVAETTAQAFGAEAEVDYRDGYPVMTNSDVETGFAAEAAAAIVGDCATDTPQTLGGEDFAFFLDECPGAYILMGNGDSAPVHHPKYNFDDDAIPFGCSWWAELAERRMPLA